MSTCAGLQLISRRSGAGPEGGSRVSDGASEDLPQADLRSPGMGLAGVGMLSAGGNRVRRADLV